MHHVVYLVEDKAGKLLGHDPVVEDGGLAQRPRLVLHDGGEGDRVPAQ